MNQKLSGSASGDRVYKVLKFIIKSGASMIPVAGGAASELFDLVIADPAIKRRERFLTDLSDRMDELAQSQRLDPQRLVDDEEFSAFLLHSIQIAIRSHGKEKIDALREATLRGTIAGSAEERQPGYVVLGLLDRLTDYHLIILKWELTPRKQYSIAAVDRGEEGTFDRLLYGQPTFADPTDLKEPHQLYTGRHAPKRYVEKQTVQNFRLAHADLVAMGLLSPVFELESYVEKRVQMTRKTNEVVGHEVSELGAFIVEYTQRVA